MNKLGVIGKPSDWLIASNVDYLKVKELFNIELIDIEISELVNIYNSKIAAEPEYFLENSNFIVRDNYSKIEQEKALILYNAIKDLIKKYNLSGITIRCFDLLKTLCTTSCLAFAILNSEGIIATCEGDIPSMISMFLVKKYLNKPSFQANPAQIDFENNTILLAHCTVPLNMCHKFDLTTHFESNIGIGINGYLNKKEVSIFKIGSTLNKFILLKGVIIETPFHQNLCRTQVKIKLLDSNVNYFLKNPLGNHHIIFYDLNTEYLENILESRHLTKVN